MIKINLLDYRDELRRIKIQKQVLKAGAVVLASIGIILASWMIQQDKIGRIKLEIAGLDAQVRALQDTVKLVKSMQVKKKRITSIISGIEKLRVKQLPATQILSDLDGQLPKEIWLTNIQQSRRSELDKKKIPVIFFDDPDKKKKPKKPGKEPHEFMVISGNALKDQAIVRFIERLEELPYFKMVFLYKTEQTYLGTTQVRKFTIYCYMPSDNKKVTA
ncbi:MAG: PilN domain-containing protein [Nitrospinaceae bacterium]